MISHEQRKKSDIVQQIDKLVYEMANAPLKKVNQLQRKLNQLHKQLEGEKEEE